MIITKLAIPPVTTAIPGVVLDPVWPGKLPDNALAGLENHERFIVHDLGDIKHLFVFGLTKTSSRMINIYFLVILELIIFKLQSSVIKMLPLLFLTSCC